MRTNTLHARPMGGVQFLCPFCSNLNGTQRINWRNGRVGCSYCKHKYRMGLLFETVGARRTLVPWNALFVPEPAGRQVNWLLDGPKTGLTAVGRVTGMVQWICPNCRLYAQIGQEIRRLDSVVVCIRCQLPFYIALVLYPAQRGQRLYTPYDWVPPGLHEIIPSDTWSEPVPAPPLDTLQ